MPGRTAMDDKPTRDCWVCRSSPAPAASGLCEACTLRTRPYDDAWDVLSKQLHRTWNEIVRRGSFDLSAAFGKDAAEGSLRTHLHFVKLLGGRLFKDKINVDLSSFAAALIEGRPHAEVTLLIAHCTTARDKFLYYESEVSVLRRDEQVYSALWTDLAYPIAVKICYLDRSAPVSEPEGAPWHPTRQRKLVKLSPYKGDTRPVHSRRDLRM